MAQLVPLPANSVINVSLWSTLCGQRIINTFQYRFDGLPQANVSYIEYLNSFFGALNTLGGLFTLYSNVIGTNCRMDACFLQPVYPTRLRGIGYSLGINGLHSTAHSTANVAASLERFGLTGGRRGVGRIQVPLPDGTYTNGSLATGSHKGQLGALALALSEPVDVPVTGTSGIYIPVIHNPAAATKMTVDIHSGYAHDTVRTMYRRTVSVGI